MWLKTYRGWKICNALCCSLLVPTGHEGNDSITSRGTQWLHTQASMAQKTQPVTEPLNDFQAHLIPAVSSEGQTKSSPTET